MTDKEIDNLVIQELNEENKKLQEHIKHYKDAIDKVRDERDSLIIDLNEALELLDRCSDAYSEIDRNKINNFIKKHDK